MKVLSTKAYEALIDSITSLTLELQKTKKEYEVMVKNHNEEVCNLMSIITNLTPKRDEKGRYIKRS